MNSARSWKIVRERDPRFDGAFVYAVRSTGIYCRPTCPSRRPRRHQVEFYPLPELAERAGFRACLRCRPTEAKAADRRIELVRDLCRRLDGDPESRPSLAELGRAAGLSPFHLQRLFKQVVSITPRQYAETRRIERFKAHLKRGSNVTDALYEAGYGSSSRLYEGASAKLGMTPATYRAGGKGARIAYTIVESPLGRLLVAATERGLCGVSLGDRARPLEEFLRGEYPEAAIRRDDAAVAPFVAPVMAALEGKAPAGHALDRLLPLDIRATAFQWRVYEALRRIPAGSTRSYSAVARSLGMPKGARAVARACATNNVAVVIPCHRVVRENGDLGGYRWGLERKQAILDRERRSAKSS